MPDDYKEAVKKGLAAKQFPYLDKALAGRDYLLGDFTVADGYLFTVLNWTNFHKIDLSAFPEHHRFHEARGRTSGRAGCDEGGRIAEGGVSSRRDGGRYPLPLIPSKRA